MRLAASSKVRAIQQLLVEEQCDWAVWMGADTVIMNTAIRFQDFLPQDASKDLIVGSDKGGGYNSGVFIFRNTDWSKRTLDDWWNMKEFVQPPGLSKSGDNSAMKALLANMEDFKDHVLVPPRCTMNSFAKFLTVPESRNIMDELVFKPWYLDSGYYHKGDFIAHAPGIDNKAEALKLLLIEARSERAATGSGLVRSRDEVN